MRVFCRVFLLLLVLGGLLTLVQDTPGRPTDDISVPQAPAKRFQPPERAVKFEAWFEAHWAEEQIAPAAAADELAILRRLSLALHGTVVSLAELRQFEADAGELRLERWTQKFLDDGRYASYCSERLGRALIGVSEGPFLSFQRERFDAWFIEQLAADRPWDEIVTKLVSAQGQPVADPATNYITISQFNLTGRVDEEIDEQQLAGRTIRAFLGQRIDCAKCHDHFFDPRWKQAHFQGLTAFFVAAHFTVHGVEDDIGRQLEVTDHETGTSRVIVPKVPFGSEWLPEAGTRRQRLAAWLTDPRNERFDRAIINRIWAQMFGRPFYSPVDDLPDPGDPGTRALDLLAVEFRAHRRELKWLIHAIAASRPFRLDSRPPVPGTEQSRAAGWPVEELERREEAWAVFPLVRLRPEQVIGSMLQAASIKTIQRDSSLFTRARKFFSNQDFVKDYGDLGSAEFSEQTGTIPQALLRMNGRLAYELIQPGATAATSAIARATEGDDALCLKTCFQVCLGRSPESEEREVLSRWLAETTGEARQQAVEDIFWTLFNSPEFSWNH